MIKRLDWDSNFFNLEVGYTNDNSSSLDGYTNFDVIYTFTQENISFDSYFYFENFAEVKVIFQKTLDQTHQNFSNIFSLKDTHYSLDEIYSLAFESGKYSRFKLDTRFSEERFEALYKAWVDNSIVKGFADEIFLYKEQEKSLGFITVKVKNNIGTVGLIAVNPNHQGKGIGKQLILHTENYLLNQGIRTLNIPTQLENIAACSFYNKLGYHIFEQTYIKHYWKK